MKPIIIIAAFFLLSFVQGNVLDNFHISYIEGRSVYNAEYASFKVFGVANRIVSQGNSDKYGRIVVNVAKGTYRLEVTFRNRMFSRQITVDGTGRIKEVTIG